MHTNINFFYFLINIKNATSTDLPAVEKVLGMPLLIETTTPLLVSFT